eukprot:5973326-Amphidinium_carterae.1
MNQSEQISHNNLGPLWPKVSSPLHNSMLSCKHSAPIPHERQGPNLHQSRCFIWGAVCASSLYMIEVDILHITIR